MMKIQKWLLIAGVVILLGVAALAAFSYAAPFALAQGPMGGWWNERGDGSGPMFGRGFGPGSGMMGRGMMFNDDFGRGFGMGPGGMMGRRGPWGGPENSLIVVAAKKLGLTTQELLTELQAGKTIADVAAEKNVAVDTIVEAVVAPRTERLNQLVTAGQLTQEQADAMLTLMKTEISEHINEAWSPRGFGRGLGSADENGGYGFGGPRGMMGGGPRGGGMMGEGRWGGPGNSPMSAVAEKLGLTRAELATELRAGKSVADVAAEKNVAVDTIVDAVLASRTARLNDLVAKGQLTQEEVDNRLANLRVDVVDWLNQSWGNQETTPAAEPDESGSF
jgi:polyhydroxyalkanoate synthesis regulator phasin